MAVSSAPRMLLADDKVCACALITAAVTCAVILMLDSLAVFTRFRVVNVTCNYNAVFAEKVVLLLCDHPMRDSAAEITLTRGHVRSVAGERATSFAPNVSHGITLTFVNL